MFSIKNLVVEFDDNTAVNNVSFDINEGEIVAIVGESGSGKSVTALTIAGLLNNEARVTLGSVLYNDKDLLKLSKKEMRSLQGDEISMIFQEPMSSLNPTMKIGKQMAEMLKLHREYDKVQVKELVCKALESTGLSRDNYDKYPHQLSGGMRQRVMIAMAMLCEPKLLIADEPTTALDVTVQEQIIKLLQDINEKNKTSILFITHNLNLARRLSDKLIVMSKGCIVESGNAKEIFENPKEEYTKKLIEAIPKRPELK
ncbi:MAG: ABC transporter ATP-binding protein [Lachnospiraceae bacterium]|nr:ABC transporter ATP-binding protein [Lachnospiraceae bacterium]